MKVFSGRSFRAKQSSSPSVSDSKHGTAAARKSKEGSSDGHHDVDSIGPRLFTPFLDTIDGVICVSADLNAAALHELLEPHQLRFPLITDATATLAEQVRASEFAPASSRFGELCDNIIGMNWKLPDQRVVRIGERVVKSTTGYDLHRFLLHSDSRFGQPVDFVLRLRPHCGMNGLICLTGERKSVMDAVPKLMPSSWMNWFDSVDVLSESGSSKLTIRIAINTPATEWEVFERELQSFAAGHGLSMSVAPTAAAPIDGCPDFTMKTTPNEVLALASELTDRHGIRCVVLCYNGVIHGYLSQTNDAENQIRRITGSTAARLHQSGGDWHSRHVSSTVSREVEAGWLAALATEFSKT